MRFLSILMAILLSLSVVAAAGCASQETTTDDSETSDTQDDQAQEDEEDDDHGAEGEIEPAITVTSPTEGQTISGSTVTVAVEVEGVELVPGGGPKDHDEGHLHIILDGGSPIMTPQTSTELTDVSAGDHTLTVDLVDNNHQSKDPEVKQTINFTVQ